jgi:hypothetical protein
LSVVAANTLPEGAANRLPTGGCVDMNLPIAAATGGELVKRIPARAAPKHRKFDETTYRAAGTYLPTSTSFTVSTA